MPRKATTPQSTIFHFAGWDLEVTHELVPLDQLTLDPDNPRIRLQLDGPKKPVPNQEELMKFIEDQPGYDNLHRQIRDQGGVHDELIVRHDGRVVEGNTRLTIAKKLSKTVDGKTKWKTLPVKRLAADVDEVAVGLLMCDYHVSGKTRWRPAAQAAEVYRLIKADAPLHKIVTATRMTEGEIRRNVAAYKYLLEEIAPLAPAARRREIIDSKFNHALEFVSRADLDDARKDKPTRKVVALAIAEDRVQGIQMRKLAPLLKNDRARETFVREGFKAAEVVDKKANPLTRSTVLKAVQNMTKKLKNMPHTEIELFIKHAKARTALDELTGAIENLRAMATPKSEKRRA